VPGGSTIAAHLHQARTVCRRAERLVVKLSKSQPIGTVPIVYLNRLSDLLFVMARVANALAGQSESPWKGRRIRRPELAPCNCPSSSLYWRKQRRAKRDGLIADGLLLAPPVGCRRIRINHLGGYAMPWVITRLCADCQDTACVKVCPVDCIYGLTVDDSNYRKMLFIHPENASTARLRAGVSLGCDLRGCFRAGDLQ